MSGVDVGGVRWDDMADEQESKRGTDAELAGKAGR